MKKIAIVIGVLFSLSGYAQDKAAALDSIFSTLHREEKFFGNVLIAENGKVLYQKSFGKANMATNADLNSESMFELASVSKQFTAMAIMLLKQQGKLNYDDSLRKFFPSLPYQHITVRQLLHHTSGLPDYVELFMKNWDSTKIATNKDIISLLSEKKPPVLFAPGEKWEYSNTGYAILASIIEKVSGMEYGAYLSKYIFKPLGMSRTRVYRRRYEKKEIPNYAYGYVYDTKNKKFVLPDDYPETAAMVYSLDGIVGDGCVNSTTTDLLKWDRALYTDKLLPPEQLQDAFKPGILNNGKETTYGFGWGLGEMKGIGKVTSHTGGWPGYNTLIERHLDSGKTIIILRNYEWPAQMMKKIRNILYDMKDEVIKEAVVGADSLLQYVGEYELAPEFSITITVEEGKLFGQATAQEKFELFAEKPGLFFLKVVEAKVEFVKDEKGKIKNLILYQNGQEVEGVKVK
jgi:CubicO group peptidase (beta-lactamase class C family)